MENWRKMANSKRATCVYIGAFGTSNLPSRVPYELADNDLLLLDTTLEASDASQSILGFLQDRIRQLAIVLHKTCNGHKVQLGMP